MASILIKYNFQCINLMPQQGPFYREWLQYISLFKLIISYKGHVSYTMVSYNDKGPTPPALGTIGLQSGMKRQMSVGSSPSWQYFGHITHITVYILMFFRSPECCSKLMKVYITDLVYFVITLRDPLCM